MSSSPPYSSAGIFVRARARANLHRQDHQKLKLILLSSFFSGMIFVAQSRVRFSMQTLSVNEILL
jgi:hypothetical protein